MKNINVINGITSKILLILVALIPFSGLYAQEKGDNLTPVFEYGAVIFLIFLFSLLLLFVLLHEMEEGVDKSLFSVFWDKFSATMNDAKPIEREQEIMLNHDYDGIKELDNNLPPWWKYLFYVTIIWSIVYMAHYHVVESGPSSDGEYLAELQAAELAKSTMSTAYNITPENVTLLTDAGAMFNGKTIYDKNCVACHGKFGEGMVGPNLTDEYFIHGKTINKVFVVIQNGVPEKGMLSWKAQLNPKEIQEVGSYVLSLVGTNPANPKAPQGEKVVVPDSLKPAVN